MEETKEQQQLYSTFRSCIYIILILELIFNLPIGVNNPIGAFLLKLLDSFRIFNSVAICKFMEVVCVLITCMGTKAKKSLDFNMKTMVGYPIVMDNAFDDIKAIAYKITKSNDEDGVGYGIHKFLK